LTITTTAAFCSSTASEAPGQSQRLYVPCSPSHWTSPHNYVLESKETVALIAELVLPSRWPDLIDQLVGSLQTSDSNYHTSASFIVPIPRTSSKNRDKSTQKMHPLHTEEITQKAISSSPGKRQLTRHKGSSPGKRQLTRQKAAYQAKAAHRLKGKLTRQKAAYQAKGSSPGKRQLTRQKAAHQAKGSPALYLATLA
ncbi:importin-alpha export receptor, partial [Paramarasmius palmivorus]